MNFFKELISALFRTFLLLFVLTVGWVVKDVVAGLALLMLLSIVMLLVQIRDILYESKN